MAEKIYGIRENKCLMEIKPLECRAVNISGANIDTISADAPAGFTNANCICVGVLGRKTGKDLWQIASGYTLTWTNESTFTLTGSGGSSMVHAKVVFVKISS